MGGKSRGSKVDSGTPRVRKSSKKTQAVTTSPEAVVDAPATDAATAATAATATLAPAAPTPARKSARPRKTKATTDNAAAEPAVAEPAVAEPAVAAPASMEPVSAAPEPPVLSAAEVEADRHFADALANAFIMPLDAVEEGAAAAAAAGSDTRREQDSERSVDLPFIIDIPREVPVVDPAEAARDEWVDLVLEPTPRKPTDQPSRPAALSSAASRARGAGKPVAKTSARPAPAKPLARSTARATPAAALRATASAPTKTIPPAVRVATAPPPAAAATRWWLVAPLLLVLAVVLVMNRPGRPHAPVPAGVIGTWTTAFWLYENQTLEIRRDTVVVTLDEPEEGRFAITKVETTDAGRETAVKITYRLDSGDEKVLDFLADKDPTTALRFRAHSGLVWTRAEE